MSLVSVSVFKFDSQEIWSFNGGLGNDVDESIANEWDEADGNLRGFWPIWIKDFVKANALVDYLLDRGYEVDYDCLKESW